MKSVLATSNPKPDIFCHGILHVLNLFLIGRHQLRKRKTLLALNFRGVPRKSGIGRSYCNKVGVYSNTRFPTVEEDGTMSDILRRQECGLCRMTKFLGRTYGEDANSKVSDRPP